MLALLGKPLELWQIRFNKHANEPRSVERIPEGYVTAGDPYNYAVFFLEQFRTSQRGPRRMADLFPLGL